MKKLPYLIVLALILGLVLTGCLLSNVGQVPTSEQSGITYLTKALPLANLVGLWHFDEGSGTTTNNSSGNNNHGTLKPTGSEPTWVPGYFSNALSFDGEDDYVEVAHNINLIPSDITIEVWIYPTSWTHTAKAVALATKRTAPVNGYFLFYYRTSNTITFDWGGSAGANRWNTGYNPPLNTWTHLAVTRSSTGRALYVNGSLYISTILAGAPSLVPTTSPLRVGYDSMAAQYPFQGTIDEVRIWDGALTADEIAYNYVLGDVPIDIKPQSCPNPLNVKSQGVLPVAILGPVDFDVNDIDPASVKLEGVSCIKWAIEDVTTPYEPIGIPGCLDCSTAGSDGFLDLILHFNTQDIIYKLESDNSSAGDIELLEDVAPADIEDGECVALTLTGSLVNDTPIKGEDSVLILRKGKQ